MITNIIRSQLYSVSAPALLPEIPARAPKTIPLEFISVGAPFSGGNGGGGLFPDAEHDSVKICLGKRPRGSCWVFR